MANKREEELIDLVFGELCPEKAERIRREMERNPELEATFHSYRTIRQDLSSLKEVPEDQMSAERLRHAILARGLEHAPKRQIIPTWLWMPAASMALAASVIVLRNSGFGAAAPEFVAGEYSKSGAETVALAQPLSSNSVAPVASTVEKPSTAPTLVVAESPRGNKSRRAARAKASGSEVAAPVLAVNLPRPSIEVMDARTVTDDAAQQPPAPAAEAVPEPPVERPALVLISDDTNEASGAMRAVEMESYRHVVVGG